jgi:hypothetical protein
MSRTADEKNSEMNGDLRTWKEQSATIGVILSPFLVLAAAVVLFFHKMAFTNLILARGDTLLYFYPYWQAAAGALRDGRVPLWNPHLFMGAPFLANSQIGFFYPLNWPLWLLLPTPYAVSATILLHLFIAAAGTYLAARRALSLSQTAALLAAVLFALGGYLTAQVEHVNQVQGLAWLPWFLAVWGRREAASGRLRLWRVAGVSGLFALQLLAGHTQTAFISGVGLGVWAVALALWPERGAMAGANRWRRLGWTLLLLLTGAGVALLLAAVQLAPTLELSRLSARQGGLPANEALSFSLNPLLLARSLLPLYGESLFSEYVAFLPLTAILLAVVGAWQWRHRPPIAASLLLVGVGLFLALGQFNPVYRLLVRLPGFDLFRAPARWLVLYALGISLLAGAGLQLLAPFWPRQGAVPAPEVRERRTGNRRPWLAGALLLLGLMVYSLLAPLGARFIPVAPEAPVALPAPLTFAAWALELLLALLLFTQISSRRFHSPYAVAAVLLLPLLALFLASRSLPYHNLTTPDAYLDLRPPANRLLAAVSSPLVGGPLQPGGPIPRFLSLSHIFFDPGDQAELDTIYAGRLPEAARYDYTIAIKQKEIIAPNLALAYGLASVDGFDGGILPLASYSEMVKLLLPPGVTTTDGRLREFVTAVPEKRWLDLFNVHYLITDKVGDVWRDGVFFDLQHAVTLQPGESVSTGFLPRYEATAVWLLAEGGPGQVRVTTSAGQSWSLAPEAIAEGLWRVEWPTPAMASQLELRAVPGGDAWQVQGLSLVDGRDGSFFSITPGDYRLIHSGDVKIYRNLDPLPRAFVVHDWMWQPDVAAAVAYMAETATFEPRQAAVLVGAGEATRHHFSRPATATIVRYEADEVAVRVITEAPGLLILSDAYYPGWQAALDGQATAIYPAYGLFRAVPVPAGEHQVTFTFVSRSYQIGRLVTLVTAALWLLLLLLVSPLGRRYRYRRK